MIHNLKFLKVSISSLWQMNAFFTIPSSVLTRSWYETKAQLQLRFTINILTIYPLIIYHCTNPQSTAGSTTWTMVSIDTKCPKVVSQWYHFYSKDLFTKVKETMNFHYIISYFDEIVYFSKFWLWLTPCVMASALLVETRSGSLLNQMFHLFSEGYQRYLPLGFTLSVS